MAQCSPMSHDDLRERKADHLDLCATDAVAFRRRNLLDDVRLMHQSLPEIHLDEVDTSVELLGKRLRAPIVIAGMTGGHERAAEINRGLASLAERRGYGFGLGSQRAMLQAPDSAFTYQVREQAPTTLLLGNLGLVQARALSSDVISKLVADVGADALCVHMNPAQELIQAGGDRDFRGGLETFARLVSELEVPVVAKETGNGISPETAAKLRSVGVEVVDVSGAGGTSWVGVETLRANGEERQLGEALWDWGVPTAASTVFAHRAGLAPIATGGMRSGLDIARAIALGAVAAGFARNVYKAFVAEGAEGADRFLQSVEAELRAVMLLSGADSIDALRRASPRIGGELREWLEGPSTPSESHGL